MCATRAGCGGPKGNAAALRRTSARRRMHQEGSTGSDNRPRGEGYTQPSFRRELATAPAIRVAKAVIVMASDTHEVEPDLSGPLPTSRTQDASRSEWQEKYLGQASSSLARAIYYCNKAGESYLEAQMKPLSMGHVLVLTYLWEGHSGDTLSNIADAVRVDPATVTRVAQRLEQLGYVERSTSSRDSRAVRLDLTDKGWRLAEPFAETARDWEERVAGHLEPQMREAVLRALQEMTERAEEARAEQLSK